ncbi:MAG TPA: hypothetical protein VF599_14250 [Pyrinomonadaceae bacterium]
MKRTLGFILFLLLSFIVTSGATRKTTHALMLGETAIRINVYENAGAGVTFFAPHHNEQLGIRLAKETIEAKGGRFVEIESFDEKGKPVRFLKFQYAGKTYSIDPNRIYTDNGRMCNVAYEPNPAVKIFADNLLKLLLPPDGKTVRENERFIVAVHNNVDVSAKDLVAQSSDLTAVAFLKAQSTNNLVHGAFQDQADGVFLSNTETDEDNFIFLSAPTYLGFFAERGFNVVVQKAASKLQTRQCSVDDGSLSVYSSLNNISYICLEADGTNGALRQRQMLEAVYALMPKETPTE